jgi:ribosomal protein L29
MRKSKEIKRKRATAAKEFRSGNKTEAYKMWADAKKEMVELRGKKAPAAAPAPAADAPQA